MTRFEKFCLLAGLLISATCLRVSLEAFEAYHLTGLALFVVWLGWLVATYGAILVAVGFRRWTNHVRPRWALHVLFVFAAYASFLLGARMMLWAIGDPDFDATLGGPVLPGLLLLFAAVAGYAVSVLGEVATQRRLRRE